jgi:hypothetical protein
MKDIDRAHLRKLRALPVEGLPPVETRPRCLFCCKRLKPVVRNVWSKMDLTGPLRHGEYPEVVRRVFEGYKGYGRLDRNEGMFCTMGCAYRFARAAVRAGWRLHKPRPA